MLLVLSIAAMPEMLYAGEKSGEKTNNCIGLNAYRCLEPREPEVLKSYPNLVRREGDSLILKIQNGKNIQFKNCKKSDCYIYYYQLEAYFPDLKYFLVAKKTIEEFAYALIDQRTGKETQIEHLPLFSPDARHFVTVNICEAHCTRRIQIWRLSGDTVKLVWTLDRGWTPKQGGIWTDGSARWVDNSTVEATIVLKTSLDSPSESRETFLIKQFQELWRSLEMK